MRFYKLALHKTYFDKGYGMTALAKYLLFGVGTWFYQVDFSVLWAVLLGCAYAVFCYFFGMWCYKSGYKLAEAEVQNQFNLFQQETRRFIKGSQHGVSWQTKQPK